MDLVVVAKSDPAASLVEGAALGATGTWKAVAEAARPNRATAVVRMVYERRGDPAVDSNMREQ